MKREELEAIKRRAEKATPGPWRAKKNTPNPGVYSHKGSIPHFITCCRSARDDAFIAHARSDIPALVAEVEKLRGWLRQLYYDYDYLTDDEIKEIREYVALPLFLVSPGEE